MISIQNATKSKIGKVIPKEIKSNLFKIKNHLKLIKTRNSKLQSSRKKLTLYLHLKDLLNRIVVTKTQIKIHKKKKKKKNLKKENLKHQKSHKILQKNLNLISQIIMIQIKMKQQFKKMISLRKDQSNLSKKKIRIKIQIKALKKKKLNSRKNLQRKRNQLNTLSLKIRKLKKKLKIRRRKIHLRKRVNLNHQVLNPKSKSKI